MTGKPEAIGLSVGLVPRNVRSLSKLPRPHDLCTPHFFFRGSPDRDLTFLDSFRLADHRPGTMLLAWRQAGLGGRGRYR